MSTAETVCYSTPDEAGLRVESLPFQLIPHQTKLFLDYLRDPLALRKFYPSAVRFHHELPARTAEVLAAQQTDRAALCDALKDMNTAWGAGAKTLANIEQLRDADCVAVVSGQQAGLFTGPLYTIYKALSAVKLAGCLSQRNTKAVPVFWIATEDHDFEEVARAEFINRECQLAGVSVPLSLHKEALPVGQVILDNSISDVIEQLTSELPNSEFIPDLQQTLRDAWQPGRSYGAAFACMMTALLGNHGLVFLDPSDARLKQLAAPLYSEAARRAPEIAAAVEQRSRELEADGYHAQVLASAASFPLFIHDAAGARHALSRSESGKYQIKTLPKKNRQKSWESWRFVNLQGSARM